MKGKRLLATLLLGAGLCFVPALGYGEVKEWMIEEKARYIDIVLLEASVRHIMGNPTNFLYAMFNYSPVQVHGGFPKGVDVTGKIWVRITDSRGVFFYNKSGIALRDQFKRVLEDIYTYIDHVATDMDADIVAIFISKEDIALAYFYQGEYHLEKKE